MALEYTKKTTATIIMIAVKANEKVSPITSIPFENM